jgi:quinol monooxygenase YgiN
MPLVSVTRFRARSIGLLPLFAFHAQRTITQVRKAEGFLSGVVRRDHDLAFWTMTVWRDESAMRAYVASGAHRKAMPHLFDWGEQACVVRWTQECADLPAWRTAVLRMRTEGVPSRLKHPGPQHADLSFRDPEMTFGTRL